MTASLRGGEEGREQRPGRVGDVFHGRVLVRWVKEGNAFPADQVKEVASRAFQNAGRLPGRNQSLAEASQHEEYRHFRAKFLVALAKFPESVRDMHLDPNLAHVNPRLFSSYFVTATGLRNLLKSAGICDHSTILP